jgi:hypothetical protein
VAASSGICPPDKKTKAGKTLPNNVKFLKEKRVFVSDLGKELEKAYKKAIK